MFFFYFTGQISGKTSIFISIGRVADVRLHILPHAGRSDSVELEACRCLVVCSHRGRVRHRRAVQQRRRARRLRTRTCFGGHALDGSNARGRRVFCHVRHCGRAHHVFARRNPVDTKRTARQTGKLRNDL